ncbi:hypothetical protein BEWA_030900 [Theileria equi strain WA]|uniref:Uncharacterized protein n=1 Tax=Theileria equi strain WA TaxID=1537102 RepID=L0AXD1_THEEQ|nr:hypothetical protein BEWA_030900 [Theileria equi strain WA]AFZ80237.1 hypothetical protein BEWA_030900 [Theileria equi strain WA]|eukprot:XP_004829903.1 hypothetical protein BEWA_030900 [Theileria equi strain WA]
MDPNSTSSDGGHKAKSITNYNAVARHYTGLNRYIIILLYCIPISVASSIYFNWSSVSRLLIRAGIYEWHCSSADIAEKSAHKIKCEVQRLKISHLLVLTRSCDMAVSVLTGSLVDKFSQRYVMLAGNIFLILGWLALAFNGQDDRLVLFAFCCIGLCASCVFMSALNVISLFSDSSGLAICFVVSVADDISTNIPLILNGMFTLFGPDGFERVCIFYIFFSVVPTMIIGLTAMPVKSWTTCIKEYERTIKPALEMNDSTLSISEETNNAPEDMKEYTAESPKRKNLKASIQDLSQSAILYLATPRFVIILICFIITNFSNIFMSNLFLKYYDDDEDVEFMSEILLSAQFIPGLILGHLFDRFSASKVNYSLNVLSILAFVLLYVHNTTTGYMFCFLQAILICVDFSTLMVYINLLFPAEHMTTITGFTLFFDGFVSLMLSYADDAMLEATTDIPIFISFGLLLVRLLLFIYLHHMINEEELTGRCVSDQGNCEVALA